LFTYIIPRAKGIHADSLHPKQKTKKTERSKCGAADLQIPRSLRRQRKLLQEFLDGGEGTADDRVVAAEYLRLIIHAQADLKTGGLEAVN
jgi:hypothetical protein